jgi:UDP-galactopyranose mutase
MKILILGGGLSGISLAYFLGKTGKDFILFEKDYEVGGLCRSEKKDGFIFDYCGHLLHFRHKSTLEFVRKLLGNNLTQYKRNAWIFSFNRFTRYPFQSNLYGLPSSIVKKCFSDFVKIHTNGVRKNNTSKNFLDWCYENFGEGITRYFMLPYNKKFWTVPLDELSCEWTKRFIVVPTIPQVTEGTLKESKRNLGYHSFFWYPKQGNIEELIKAFLRTIDREKIKTNHAIKRIDLLKKEIVFMNGNTQKFKMLFTSIPLPELSKIIVRLPKRIKDEFKKLRWVSVYNLNLGLEGEIKPGWHWIYFPEKDYVFFRVGFFHNFSSFSAPPGKSSLYVEVSYSKEKPLDKKNIEKRIIEDLKKAKIISASTVIKSKIVNDIKYAYPLYDHNWRMARIKIFDFLRSHNILSMGRFGSWKYMSMEDIIIEAKKIANIISHL